MRYIVIFAVIASTIAAAATDFTGWWSAKVAGIPVVIHFKDGTNGTIDGVMYSPSQSADSFPLDHLNTEADTLRFTSSLLRASFEGVKVGDSIDGMFRQGGIGLQISLTPCLPEEARIARPQTPVAPFPYEARDVTVKRDTSVLAGTLTIPQIPSPKGGVVFATGSGRQDRDESVAGHKPFAVIADYLTRAGWVTLRCDDRGVGGSSIGETDATYTDLAGDPLAQIAYLRSLPELKDKPIGIIGHSQGGNIAFVAAAENPKAVNFLITLAAPGLKGTEIVQKQNELLVGDFMTDSYKAVLHKILNLLASDYQSDEIRDEVTALGGKLIPPQQLDKLVATSLSHDYRTLLRHDPRPYMELVKCPVLALNGTNDLQVEAAPNLKAIAAAIPGAIVKELPGINHLFQPCTEPTLNYASIAETIDPTVLQLIRDFLNGLQ